MGVFLKKGQLTVFILLGVSIMVVFFFLLKMQNEIQKSKLEQEVSTVMVQMSNTKAVTYYIELCLKQSAEESIYLLGNGGFRIYKDSNGSSLKNQTPFKKSNLYNKSFDTSYILSASDLKPPFNSSVYYNVPWYPEKFDHYDYIYPNRRGYYPLGDVLLPKLCDKNGPNNPSSRNNLSGSSCEMTPNVLYFSDNPDTLQIQLQDYTSYLFLKCIDQGYLTESFGRKVSLEKPNTTVILAESDVIFNMNIPIDISITKSGISKKYYTSIRMYNIETKVPVRLKRDYEFVRDAIDKDIKNLSFNLRNSYNTLRSYKNLNYANKNISFVINEYDDNTHIMLINDYGSSVFGSPYQMIFYMENRKPILDFIHQTSLVNNFDIDVYVGDSIIIDPVGYEPDDEEMFYIYEGWQETESYSLDMSCCVGYDTSPICLKDKPVGCVSRNDSQIHAFTSSNVYQANHKTVSYQTGYKDVGEHNLTLYLCDSHSVNSINKSKDCDFQIIKILVKDLGQILPESYNNFSDSHINKTHASIEDLYTLDASHQIGIITNPVGPFRWCDSLDFTTCYDVMNSIFILPNGTNSSTNMSRLIQDIDKLNYDFDVVGNHNVSLYFGINIAGMVPSSQDLPIKVFKCLPHKSSAKSFPFNNFTGDEGYVSYGHIDDPFQADHTCCGDGNNGQNYGNYFPASKSCYDFSSYGGFWSFNDSRFTGLKTDKKDFISYPVNWSYYGSGATYPTTNTYDIGSDKGFTLPPYNYALSKYEKENDVYERTFNTYCRGDRGNICDNNPSELRKINGQKCEDTMETWQSEKCIGPNPNVYFVSNELTFQSVTSCSSYGSLQSFDRYLRENGLFSDSLFSSDSAKDATDGQCGETYKCVVESSIAPGLLNYGRYNPSISYQGYFLAKGLCDGTGGCSAAYIANNGVDYTGTSNPGTYWSDATPFGDNTIDCRCYARSAQLGSITGSSYSSSTVIKSNNKGTNNQWISSDNEADVYNYTSTTMGYCENGKIYTCGQNGAGDGCIENISISKNKIYNRWIDPGVNTYLRQYLTYNKDKVCDTNELCGDDTRDFQDLDPDDDPTLCTLFGGTYNSTYDATKGYPTSERKCCYDDSDEIMSSTCRLPSECIYGNVVYSNGYPVSAAVEVDHKGSLDYCNSGTWTDCPGNGDVGSYCGTDEYCSSGTCQTKQSSGSCSEDYQCTNECNYDSIGDCGSYNLVCGGSRITMGFVDYCDNDGDGTKEAGSCFSC